MLYPTIEQFGGAGSDRYAVTVATAKCARAITDEHLEQKALAEKAAAAGKDAEFVVTVDRTLDDVKAVRVAIDRIHEGQYRIVRLADRPTEVIKVADEPQLTAATDDNSENL